MSDQEGSVRARAEQVAKGVREAANHRRAPLLIAVGAERPTPQSTASAAEVLGLTAEEEKLAKWVGVLKRDAEELFGIPFFDALQSILSDKERRGMETQRGRGFFEEKAQLILRRLVEDLLNAGISFQKRSDFAKFVFDLPPRGSLKALDGGCHVVLNERYELVVQKGYAMWAAESLKIDNGLPPHLIDGLVFLSRDDGFPDIKLGVYDKRAMNAARRFARAWEAKSRQLKGSREAKATVIQDFV